MKQNRKLGIGLIAIYFEPIQYIELCFIYMIEARICKCYILIKPYISLKMFPKISIVQKNIDLIKTELIAQLLIVLDTNIS